jgi:hypothetical protein
MLKFSNHVANNDDQDQRKLSIISSGLLSFITNKPADNKHQQAAAETIRSPSRKIRPADSTSF